MVPSLIMNMLQSLIPLLRGIMHLLQEQPDDHLKSAVIQLLGAAEDRLSLPRTYPTRIERRNKRLQNT